MEISKYIMLSTNISPTQTFKRVYLGIAKGNWKQ